MNLSRNELMELMKQDARAVRRIETLKAFERQVWAELDREGPDGDEEYVDMLTMVSYRIKEKVSLISDNRFCQED